MTKAIEAAARAMADFNGDYEGPELQWQAYAEDFRVGLPAYLAAMEAEGFVMARAEPVHGANIDEWRTNISLDLYRSGDLVLAWVNQGDINAALLSATPHDDGGSDATKS